MTRTDIPRSAAQELLRNILARPRAFGDAETVELNVLLLVELLTLDVERESYNSFLRRKFPNIPVSLYLSGYLECAADAPEFIAALQDYAKPALEPCP